jgi:hypothetical protein
MPVVHAFSRSTDPGRQQPTEAGLHCYRPLTTITLARLAWSGVIDHVAFGSRGFEAIKQHLTGKGVPFRVNQVPNSRRWQIFLTDPNNVMIELNFDVAKEESNSP